MTSVLACNLDTINETERPRYDHLVKRLRGAMRDRREVPNGFTYKMNSSAITLTEVAERFTLERLCCPFLTFDLAVCGEEVQLTLSGPPGAQAILREAFPDDIVP